MKAYKYLDIITGLFAATLIISNTMAVKIFTVGPFAFPVSIVVFPMAYLFGDILTEVYGYAASRKVIWTGFAALLLMTACYAIGGKLPAAPFWPHQDAYDAIFGAVPRIVLASMVAYFTGEFCNSFILAKIKIRLQGRWMGARFILSTLISQLIDTILFLVIAFAGIFPAHELLVLIASSWGAKVAWEIVALPLTLPLVRRLKVAEAEDHYDIGTDFNPFSLSS